MKRTVTQWAVLFTAVLLATGCAKENPTFSVLPESKTFVQDTKGITAKIDVLWVIDNSGSMRTSQENLADNFTSFIKKFKQKNYDFQLAVTTTDAYKALPQFNSGTADWDKARFRDGTDDTSHTGEFLVTPSTPNLVDTFLTNVLQGTDGSGDERPLQSISTTLDNPLNDNFLRQDSFLAVVVVTDEDDFSHDGVTFLGGEYDNPDLHAVDSYVDYLDNLTGSDDNKRRYSVSSIAINNNECLDQLNDYWKGRKVAKRVTSLTDKTNGVKGNLCGDFAKSLRNISDKIIELSTQFYLEREPIVDTIEVTVDGTKIPNVEDSSTGGWSYNKEANSVRFHGEHIPEQGAVIDIDFDPVSLDFDK